MERNLLSLIYLTPAWMRMAMHSAIAQGRELSFYITILANSYFPADAFCVPSAHQRRFEALRMERGRSL